MSTPETGEPPVDDAAMWTIWLSGQSLLALLAAYRVGLLAALTERDAVNVDEFAAAESLDPRVLRAVVVLLDRLGIVREYHPAGRRQHIVLDPRAREPLVTWLPMYNTMDDGCRLSGDVLHALRGGGPRAVWTQDTVDAVTPDVARRHLASMHAHSLLAARRLARCEVFAGARRLLDVGGGSGCYAQELARRLPGLLVDVAELPPFAPYVRDFVAPEVRDRVRVRPVTFGTDRLRGHYDRILFSNFLHDHGEQAIIGFLGAAESCLGDGGRVVIHEVLLDGADAGAGTGAGTGLEAAQLSLHLATWTPGRQYERAEFAELLAAAGLRLTRTEHIGPLHSVLVAERA
jgi:cyclopropane fatty-acyl-phospholipid synthase-like methyltransferase